MPAIFDHAWQGALAADALAMPAHWYYDRAALDRDYGRVDTFRAPHNPHPDSILWRSKYEPACPEGDILHDQAQYWGERGVHYHQHLSAGGNTVNYQLGQALYVQVKAAGSYDPRAWAEKYVELMRTPNWHSDTYVEEYHRGFFERVCAGKDLLKCGIRDEHIGGLSHVPALMAALPEGPLESYRQQVKTHVTLTHRHSNVLRAADCLVRLLWNIQQGETIPEAIMTKAGDWFSTKKAEQWAKHEDRVVIGEKLSPACYIDQSFPASLYLAWKYHDDPKEGIIANVMVGGDNCHRGAVVGALLGQVAGKDLREEF